MIPGEYQLRAEAITANAGRETRRLLVANTGDRPIQVGSHCHFFEVNRALAFPRAEGFGFRLNIPSGTAVRFEPGESKRVELVRLGGARRSHGLNGLTGGATDEAARAKALARARAAGFSDGGEGGGEGGGART